MVENYYNQCLFSCPPADFECFSFCAREYEEFLEKCPCQPKCPDGCPCPEYECPTVTTTELTTLTTTATTSATISTTQSLGVGKIF